MRKTIYAEMEEEGEDHGLFDVATFERFMQIYRGAVEVESTLLDNVRESVQIYHIQPQGVTLRHYSEDSLGEVSVEVELFGRERVIGQVEKKILRAAEKFRQTRELFGIFR